MANKFLLNQTEATTAIRQFTDQPVTFVRNQTIGPDDELFTFRTPDGNLLYLLVRDYIGHNLDYEASNIKKTTGLEVAEFLKVKNSHNFAANASGLPCLAFTEKQHRSSQNPHP